MQSSQSEIWESQTCYPRVQQARQAIPEFNGGNPRYKGSPQASERGNQSSSQSISQRSRGQSEMREC